MAFDWNDYLLLASQLSRDPNEAEKRTAISRAYYAAYGKAREFLEQNYGEIPRDENPHQYVWDSFDSDPCSLGNTIRHVGNLLRLKRVDADYRSRIRLTIFDVDQALDRSAAIISDIAKLSP